MTHDRYFLDNVAGWILELDRGSGIPFEGNYSQWLNAKAKRMSLEENKQSALNKTIATELEFINQKAKGQQKKGQARMRRYDDLVTQASSYVKSSSVDSITIPVGPRLGNVVVEAEQLSKSFDGRCLVRESCTACFSHSQVQSDVHTPCSYPMYSNCNDIFMGTFSESFSMFLTL